MTDEPLGPDAGRVSSNDDCGFGFNSCLDIALAESGTYFLGVTTFAVGERGSYQLAIVCPARAPPGRQVSPPPPKGVDCGEIAGCPSACGG